MSVILDVIILIILVAHKPYQNATVNLTPKSVFLTLKYCEFLTISVIGHSSSLFPFALCSGFPISSETLPKQSHYKDT